MGKYKLKKGMTIGALAAENDKQFLDEAFVDNGSLGVLLDVANPRFVILGRAGAGKTALIDKIRQQEHASPLDPEELSMQYLQNRPILQTVKSWGVNLEIFYKYLWRHVCILELIRMRYGVETDVPSVIQSVFSLGNLFSRDKKKAREASQEYLREYGNEYWITADTRIKQITSEIEDKLKSDDSVAAGLSASVATAKVGAASASERRAFDRVETSVVERAQAIVSDFLIADLNRVVELLAKHGFNDAQRRYYLVIDDLDKNWMPDDLLYLDLLKSLLYTVQDLNRRLTGVKIIVALRENIYHRVFRKASQHEPQREKWADLIVRVRWTAAELTDVVNRRLAVVFRGEYTQDAPSVRDVLPDQKRKGNDREPFAYILDRTFLRPRDVIDFINTIFEHAETLSQVTWHDIYAAEIDYSKRRLESVLDEWRDSYFGIAATYPMLRAHSKFFNVDDLTDDEVEGVLVHDNCDTCAWLKGLRGSYLDGARPIAEIRIELLRILFLVGLVGVKFPDSGRFVYGFEQIPAFTQDALDGARFRVHPMFLSALGMVRHGEGSNDS